MKKNIKILSAIILAVSLSVAFFSACDSKDNNSKTEKASETSFVHETDYTYYSVLNTNKEETKYIHTVPPVPTEKETKKPSATTSETAVINEENTTGKKPSDGKVEEIANGISLITKTSPVIKGSAATIVIQGAPNTNYTIEFYKNNTQKASYDGLSNMFSDSSGFATWTFLIEEDCEPGDRKIIIKEKNSDKFIQTSITVQ